MNTIPLIFTSNELIVDPTKMNTPPTIAVNKPMKRLELLAFNAISEYKFQNNPNNANVNPPSNRNVFSRDFFVVFSFWFYDNKNMNTEYRGDRDEILYFFSVAFVYLSRSS